MWRGKGEEEASGGMVWLGVSGSGVVWCVCSVVWSRVFLVLVLFHFTSDFCIPLFV